MAETHRRLNHVVIVSPCSSTPAVFPHVFNQGIRRMKEVFGFVPTVKQSCFEENTSPQDKARELNEAFADPTCEAIFCAIGGDDSIRVLPHLDKQVIANNYKPFFGYSDATNLHLFFFDIWNRNECSQCITFYGGAVMCQFAMQGGMHEFTVQSLQQAIRRERNVKLQPHEEGVILDYYNWMDPANLARQQPFEKIGIWDFVNNSDASEKVSGWLFGGCVEVLYKGMAANIINFDQVLMGPADDRKHILFLETSNAIPDAIMVSDFVQAYAARGFFSRTAAVFVAHPKTRFLGKPPPQGEIEYRVSQREAILNRMRDFGHEDIPVVFQMNFGHTDPQTIIPFGGWCEIDLDAQSISINYK